MEKMSTRTPVPVSKVINLYYGPETGKLGMSLVFGSLLDTVWDGLDDLNKEGICREIWSMNAQWRKKK